MMSGINLSVFLSYLDDIVLFSATIEQHLERLVIILDRLRLAGLKLKQEKCCLFTKSVSFLRQRHIISENGIDRSAEDASRFRLAYTGVSGMYVPSSD